MKRSLHQIVVVWMTIWATTGGIAALSVSLGVEYNVTSPEGTPAAVNFRESNPGIDSTNFQTSVVANDADRNGRSYAAASSSSNSNSKEDPLNLTGIVQQLLPTAVKGGTWRVIRLWEGESRAESVVSSNSAALSHQQTFSFFIFPVFITFLSWQ